MLLAIPVGGLGLLSVICVVQISRMLGQDNQSKQSTGYLEGPGVVVGSLSDAALLSSDYLYDIGFWRKLGKLHRVGSSGVSRDKAIQEVEAAFVRAGVEIVNAEVNTNSELTVWTSVCSGSGMLEGRRLGGASIKRVLWQDGYNALPD